MKNSKLPFLLIVFLLGISVNCHKEGSQDFLFDLTQAPPFISEINPRLGTPTQNHSERPYPATTVIIKGRNFSTPGTRVLFNTIEATPFYNTGNEIQVNVPDGAKSGSIFIIKPEGQCLPGEKTGFNCSGANFFVDCYSPYKEEYGKEIAIDWGESKNIEFSGIETKAFRVEYGGLDLPPSNLTIVCPGSTTVRYFTDSCSPSDLVLVRDPIIPVQNVKIMQFFVTAAESTCSIAVR